MAAPLMAHHPDINEIDVRFSPLRHENLKSFVDDLRGATDSTPLMSETYRVAYLREDGPFLLVLVIHPRSHPPDNDTVMREIYGFALGHYNLTPQLRDNIEQSLSELEDV